MQTLVFRRQVTSYEATFQLIFSRLVLAQQEGKHSLATAVDFCVAEGWRLVRSARLFQSCFECLEAFLTNLKALFVDIFETKTPV